MYKPYWVMQNQYNAIFNLGSLSNLCRTRKTLIGLSKQPFFVWDACFNCSLSMITLGNQILLFLKKVHCHFTRSVLTHPKNLLIFEVFAFTYLQHKIYVEQGSKELVIELRKN